MKDLILENEWMRELYLLVEEAGETEVCLVDIREDWGRMMFGDTFDREVTVMCKGVSERDKIDRYEHLKEWEGETRT